VLVIVITVVGLVISFALPRLVLPKFSKEPTSLLFHVHVVDDAGAPIPKANVSIGTASAKTDVEGYCEVSQSFLAKGIKGLSGTCTLEGEMRVEAPGYIAWHGSLGILFGRNYNYFDKGTTLERQVTLHR
jgi:hypothetical protein